MIVLIKHYFVFRLAKAHLHSALKSHEEAMKARQICRHCRKIAGLQKVNAFSLQGNTDCFWYINKMSVFILFSNVAYFSKALQEARVQTTDTLVAMEEEDDFEDPLTPTPVKGK